MTLSSILRFSALVWVSSIFWFSLDLFYVVYVQKKLFNEVPIIFTAILLLAMGIGSLAFLIMLGSFIGVLFKKKPNKKIKFRLSGRHMVIVTAAVVFILFILIKSIGINSLNEHNLAVKITTTPTLTLVPTTTPTPTAIYQPQATKTPSNSGSNNASDPWGVAKQVSEHTWTMKIGMDPAMATPQEILDALNAYRQLHGSGNLAWDNNLGTYAQSRAEYFNKIGNIDEHKGFMEFTSDINNLKQLNFYYLGENSSYGYKMTGTHLIEWIYAGDKPHDDNQLNPQWTHVGVGVSGTETDLIFGK